MKWTIEEAKQIIEIYYAAKLQERQKRNEEYKKMARKVLLAVGGYYLIVLFGLPLVACLLGWK